MKIVSVVGVRPEFVQVSPLKRALSGRCKHIIVHTGQHYDPLLSDIFFQELGMPDPDYYLEIGSGPHGQQTGRMLEAVEAVIQKESPAGVVVSGDTNSTLAGALAAAKLCVPLAHVEAGLRSHVRTMPEELNRIVADHVATLLFCSTEGAVNNLAREGITDSVHLVGDVMYDSLLYGLSKIRGRPLPAVGAALEPAKYDVLTIHRAGNTDNPDVMAGIFRGLADPPRPILFPIHPRTKHVLDRAGLKLPEGVIACAPLGYLEMLNVLQHACRLLTDSGGMQKEAYLLGIPCITLRDETEWPETVEAGWNHLAGASPDRVREALESFAPYGERPPLYGDGHAAEKIASVLLEKWA